MSTPPQPTANSSESPPIPPPSGDTEQTLVPPDRATEPPGGPTAAGVGAATQAPGYEIVRELGRGGMGVVYLAKNLLMNRLEVLKVANRALVERESGAERFLREIRAAARLNHENVVKAYSALQVGDLLAFAMEYVEGEDLARAVQRRGPLPVATACQYAFQAALGLQHAHEQGMVHRDIKPHNLLLARHGEREVVKVLDFGLAKAVREGETAADLTGPGAMMGTPAFMAPEQAQDAAGADIRADVYSLGCTLYFLMTGTPPFTGKSHFAVLQAHVSSAPTPLARLRADAPPELEAVTARMMAKDPAARYQTPAEAAAALAPFLPAGAAESGPPAPRPVQKRSRRWRIAAVVAAVVLAAGAVAVWLAWPPGKSGVTPLDAAEARRLQLACADSLGQPVLREVDLGDGVRLKLALIPPGSFLMGSPAADAEAEDDEKPRHKTTITKAFYVGIYPVTQEQYVRVTGRKNPSYFSSDGEGKDAIQGLDTSKFPVEEVSWEDATAFCETLNRMDAGRPAGWKYALPTEAQWEHACRAGTTTVYFFGDPPRQLGDYSWYADNSGGRTHEVGTRKPNPWGLYDRGGNVYQWCLDGYAPYSPADQTDPHNDNTSDARVLRGGSWHCQPENCRSAYRWVAPSAPHNNAGFRVCLNLD